MKNLDISWVKKAIKESDNIIDSKPYDDPANTYLAGVEDFRKTSIKNIMTLEDRLYEDDDTTTPKELLSEIINIIENLKAE